jgi:hypothetical protein
VVWSEPKTDKLVLGCFVKIVLHHKTGMLSNKIRISALVRITLVSIDGIHDNVHVVGMTIEIITWADEDKLQADDCPLASACVAMTIFFRRIMWIMVGRTPMEVFETTT